MLRLLQWSNIRFLASLSEQLIRNPYFLIFHVIRDPNAQAVIRACHSRITPNGRIVDEAICDATSCTHKFYGWGDYGGHYRNFSETRYKEICEQGCGGGIVWGVVCKKRVFLKTRSHICYIVQWYYLNITVHQDIHHNHDIFTANIAIHGPTTHRT